MCLRCHTHSRVRHYLKQNKNIYTYHVNINFEFFLFFLWNCVLYLQLKHYAKFSLAHKLISFYKSVGCLIVHHCIGKSQLVRTGTSWKNTEHFTDILNSEVGSWRKTVENPCQAKTAYAETPLCQETLGNSRMLPADCTLNPHWQISVKSSLIWRKDSLWHAVIILLPHIHTLWKLKAPPRVAHLGHSPGALVGNDFLSQCVS